MTIENEAQFNETFEALKDLLSEIESSEPSFALVNKMQAAERMNQDLETWIDANVRSAISLIVSVLHFSSPAEARQVISDLRSRFRDHDKFILDQCRTNNIQTDI